ncbi:MAG: Rrf2 family transcriptional regulator [Treponema sp.]|jgi:Rrf2 family iron-sulfur cluster assembly transcriptional regulator|nr:Rrf2 family transcriptional regulator [Treponema sp.]
MRITTRGRYALRATLALTILGKGGIPVSVGDLSEYEDISPVFLEQIFFRLRKAGIVRAVRGPGGGFFFTRPPEDLTAREILLAAGENLGDAPCDKHAESCDRVVCCPSHKVWVDLNRIMNDYLAGLTLSSILKAGAASQ